MKFCAFIVEEAKNVGKDQALQLKMPFNENAVLLENQTFLLENMPTIKTIQVLVANDPANDTAYPDSKQVRESAVPGKPVAHFF